MLLLTDHPPSLAHTGTDDKHSPELLDVGDSSREPGAVPRGGAFSDAEVRKGAAPERLVLSLPHHFSFLWGLYGPVVGAVFAHSGCVV